MQEYCVTYKKKAICIITTLFILLNGCAGIGFIATSNPYQKLDQAGTLMQQDRPLLAELTIRDALENFKKNENELGMADAYHAYGNLYKDDSYHGRWAAKFKELGTYDGTYIKSITNFEKAKELFEKNGDEIGVVKCLVGIGNAYSLRGEDDKACMYYKDALSRYRAGKDQGTINREPIIYDKRYKDIGELIEAFIKKSCDPYDVKQ